nr:Nudix family hydrolase [Pseudomarimonas arenosa]
MSVVAAALTDADGRVLLAQRPSTHHHAGLWEFPGGKREQHESPLQALRRELHEELGIEVQSAEPLICIPFDLGQRPIELDVYQVSRFAGVPVALEHQALHWVERRALAQYPLPQADRPAAAALSRPDRMAVTPEGIAAPSVAEGVIGLLRAGHRLIQLRCPQLDASAQRELAAALLPDVRKFAADLLLNGDIEGAERLGCGLHLRSAQLQQTRPRLASGQILSAACHDLADLARAEALRVDCVVLGAVMSTATHPGRAALGWAGFAQLRACSSLPIYAIGGLCADDLTTARRHGAQGVAAIRAFWPLP